MKLRTVFLTTAAFALAAACTPAAETPVAEAPPATDIAEPAPELSGPAAENTTDSLASTPADAPAATDAGTTTPAAPPAATPAPAASPAADAIATGRAAYAQSCAMCHGPAGAGTNLGVALTAGLDAASIKEKVVKGKINATDIMPAMGAAFSEEQLDALAIFIEDGLPQ